MEWTATEDGAGTAASLHKGTEALPVSKGTVKPSSRATSWTD